MWFLFFISMLYISLKYYILDKCKTRLFSISLGISRRKKSSLPFECSHCGVVQSTDLERGFAICHKTLEMGERNTVTYTSKDTNLQL